MILSSPISFQILYEIIIISVHWNEAKLYTEYTEGHFQAKIDWQFRLSSKLY